MPFAPSWLTLASFKGSIQGIKYGLTFQTFGLQFAMLNAKKPNGFVIKWFHLVGSSLQKPQGLVVHHARRQAYGAAGFIDSDPTPESSSNPKKLTIVKYPKLRMDRMELNFADYAAAKATHKAIRKRLARLGQGTLFSTSSIQRDSHSQEDPSFALNTGSHRLCHELPCKTFTNQNLMLTRSRWNSLARLPQSLLWNEEVRQDVATVLGVDRCGRRSRDGNGNGICWPL